MIFEVGSYRQAYRNTEVPAGFRIALYALRSASKAKRTVGSSDLVKAGLMAAPRQTQPSTWGHPMYGDYDGKPPPQLTRAQALRMQSQDERDWLLGNRDA